MEITCLRSQIKIKTNNGSNGKTTYAKFSLIVFK